MAPFAAAGVLVEAPERVPVRLGQLAAGEMDDLGRRLRRGALLEDRLALARRQRGREVGEARIAGIGPVELAADADQPSRRLEQRDLALLDERRVRRGQAVLGDQRLGRPDQPERRVRIDGEQARAGDGGERHRDLELGIIAPTGAGPGVGPAVVEDIFALAVALGIGRRGANERLIMGSG